MVRFFWKRDRGAVVNKPPEGSIAPSEGQEEVYGQPDTSSEVAEPKLREVIGGKLYDTEKATLICGHSDENRLYVTDKGNFFRITWLYGTEIWLPVSKEGGVDAAASCRGIDWVLEHLGDYIAEA